MPNSQFLDLPVYDFNGIAHDNSIQEITVLQNGIFGWIRFRSIIMSTKDIGNGNFKMLGKFMVAFITTGYGHNGASSIPGKHIFGDPDRNFTAIKGIDSICT